MANILIGTPCYNGWVCTDYMVSMLGLQRELGRQGIGFSLEMTTTVSLIPVARNFIVSKLLERQEFTHLLFIDADIGFHPGLVPRYLAANKDIVAGVYPIKNLNLPAIRRLPVEKSLAAALDYAVVPCQGEQANSEGFIRAEYAATGFMLIRREVLEKMAAHYSDLKYHDSFTFVDAPKAGSNDYLYALFDTSLDPNTRRYLPEDYTFCNRWRAMGGEIWVDALSTLAHVGSFVFQGDYSAVVKKA